MLTGCNNSEIMQKESELKQKELELKDRETSIKEQEKIDSEIKIQSHKEALIRHTQSKFIYVVIKTNEPRIESNKIELPPPIQKDPIQSSNLLTGLVPEPVEPHYVQEPKYLKYAVSQYYYYTSDIVEIPNYSEDSRYMVVDKYQNQVNISLASANIRIQSENSYMPGDHVNADAKIISKESFVFDSYKEASISRDANKQ